MERRLIRNVVCPLNWLTARVRRWYCRTVVIHQCGAWQAPLYVNFRSRVTRNTYLGCNVNFNGMHIRGRGRVTIGNNFHSGQDCLILTDSHKYDGGNAIPYDTEVSITRDVVIADNVWFGDRVLVLPGVHIGEGAIIQAGSVVVRDIEALGIAGGHPAKVFKWRDRANYANLKLAGKFH